MRTRTQKTPAPAPAKAPWSAPGWLSPVILAAAAVILLGVFSKAITDTDFWWHLKTGQYIWQNHALPVPDPFGSMTYSGKPAYPGEETVRYFNLTHEWLAQVILYLVYALAGFPGVVLLRALSLSAVCAIVGWLSFRRSGRLYLSVAAAAGAALVVVSFAADRPYQVTFLLMAVTLAVMEYRRGLWLLPPLFLFWANCHSGFFLGWVIMGAYCAEDLFQAWRKRAAPLDRRLWIVTIVSILVSGLNPNGFRVFEILLLYRRSPLQSSIMEWMRPKYWEATPFTVLLYGGAATLLWARSKARVADWLLYTLFAVAALSAARNVFLIGMLAPIVMASYLPWKRLMPVAAEISLALALIAGTGALLARSTFQFRADNWNLPSGAADFMLAHHVTGRLLNTYETGGYLMWRLWPQERVLVDGRALNESVHNDYKRMAYNADEAGGATGLELVKKYGVEVIVMPMLDTVGEVFLLPAALAVGEGREWKLVYRDASAVVFMRTPPEGVQPLNPLEGFATMESQCTAYMEHSGYSGCARALSKVFGIVGDSARAAQWARIYRQHADLPDKATEYR